MIQIYSDGSCKNTTTKEGGWAYIVILSNGEELDDCGYCEETTNNRMEMMAVIEGLKSVYHIKEPKTVISDSKYVVDGATSWMPQWKKDGWGRKRGRKVMNLDLWQELDSLIDGVVFKWVRGHDGNKYNEMCDMMASVTIENYSLV